MERASKRVKYPAAGCKGGGGGDDEEGGREGGEDVENEGMKGRRDFAKIAQSRVTATDK